MIIVKLMGGLGNQLFQVAYAKEISKKTGDETIILDLSGYKSYKIREFSLNNFNLIDSVIVKDELNQHVYYKISHKVYRLFQKVRKIVFRKDKIGFKIFNKLSNKGLYFNFDRYYYDINYNTSKGNKYVYGYFQSEKYYKDIISEIKEDFKVKVPPTDNELKLLNKMSSENSVAVSMRLGDDYRNNKSLNVCTDEYYLEGINYIMTQIDNATIYVFSDEINRAKKLNYPCEVEFVEGFTDYQSLRLMSSCKHFVIANSSFSWWGSYLSSNEEKIIVAPNKWYNDSFNKPDIFMENMIEINVK